MPDHHNPNIAGIDDDHSAYDSGAPAD